MSECAGAGVVCIYNLANAARMSVKYPSSWRQSATGLAISIIAASALWCLTSLLVGRVAPSVKLVDCVDGKQEPEVGDDTFDRKEVGHEEDRCNGAKHDRQ